MQIGFFFDGASEVGGIFQQTKAYIKKINNRSNNKKDKFIIIVNSKKTSKLLKKENIKHLFFNKSIVRRIFLFLFTIRFFEYFYLKFKILNPFEKFLRRNKIDLIVFNSPSYYVFYTRNVHYVANIWNTEIKNLNFFPEFLENSNYTKHDAIIKEVVMHAFRIIVFSEDNIKDLEFFYNCPKEKILTQVILPYLPIIYEEKMEQINKIEKNFLDLDLQLETTIFLYPAQYYPHKNHKFLIDIAENIKNKTSKKFLFIFTGVDKGNLTYLKKITENSNLNKNIKFFENLKNEYLIKLYLLSDALISSTYLGRLSLPLLEAFYFKKPVFYSKGVLDNKIEKKVYSFDLNNKEDLTNKLIDFINNKGDFHENLNNNRIYYDLNCTNNSFENIYNIIFNQFKFFQNKWK